MIEDRLSASPNPTILAILDAVRDYEERTPEDDVILLTHVRNAIDVLIADITRFTIEEDYYDSAWTPAQFLRNDARLSTGTAMALVDVAGSLYHLPATLAALEAGEIGFSHVALMAEARARLGEHFDERTLLSHARGQTVTHFRKTLEHARHAADPEAFAEDEAEAREHRYLKLSPTENGAMFLKGWLEPEGASFVRAALEPLARMSGAGDDRNRERRLGDALVELAGDGVRTELVVSMPLETLLEAEGASAAETEWGGIVSSSTVRRLLCDADVRRLVLDAEGEVVDFGRRKRLFSGSSKRALAARDGGCVFPGCDRPPRWCHGHHRKSYAAGGHTHLRNGELLCARHHHLCHEGGWKLVRDGPAVRAIPPARAWAGAHAPG